MRLTGKEGPAVSKCGGKHDHVGDIGPDTAFDPFRWEVHAAKQPYTPWSQTEEAQLLLLEPATCGQGASISMLNHNVL